MRALLTAAALLAFAANSLLCRLALREGAADPAGFTALRLGSGAAVLLLAARGRLGGSWAGAAALLVYAVGFSFAYVRLPAGTGALILFGSVQGTMLVAGYRAGERPRPVQWLGFLLALAGLAGLTLPGASAPTLGAAASMATAGVAWGLYSLLGRGASDPTADTAGNFVRSCAPLVLLLVLAAPALSVTPRGAVLAATSGALTSGLGYVAWYAAVRRLSRTQAAIVQLAVPVLAAWGGVALLGEVWTGRLVACGAAVLAGVALGFLTGR
ncbi:MAG TPA: DMT family transporter [Candidatus Polarisedimenticolaceae bacterium]|nr:DMT family transporter [Candidatus Polarisedimenticolaceae bacterium]